MSKLTKRGRGKSLVGYMDYDNDFRQFTGEFYFKKPNTRHIHSWIVAKKVLITEMPKNKRGKR
jgi:hypothetical protein